MKTQVIVLKRATHPQSNQKKELWIGPHRNGPRLCIKCGKPFTAEERWYRYTSPAERNLKAYSIGFHEQCQK